MSGKSRRRVTVESKTLDGSDKRKMSVFERLGPGAPSRKNREEVSALVTNFFCKCYS